jgi:hypothetical protein
VRPCVSVMGATPSPDAAGGVWYPRILFRNIEKVAAARGLHKISASIMVRLTETTLTLLLNNKGPAYIDVFAALAKAILFREVYC